MKKAGTETKVTAAAINKVVNNDGASKSSRMKTLFDMGLEVKEIATLMGTRYNFVYNVVSNYCSMNGIELVTTKKESQKDKIVELYWQGKSNKEISIALKTNYNYVFNVLKKYKAEHPVGVTEDEQAAE